ncbi:related to anaphase promoting complex subunit 10 [Ustilago sp. UG-2017b]|nr:related to anaphase promoting complex subunit 10 [Ustilago sp. UG-2017b]
MEHEAIASSSRVQPALSPPSTTSTKHKRRRRINDIEDRTTKTDVGLATGTSWTLSSYKPGSGVPELRSPDLTKLWQSDGNQPHLINIQFSRRTCVTHLSIYLDVKQDDSYTPTRVAVKAGTNYHDLTMVRQRTFDSPQGWKHFSMTPGGAVDSVASEEDEEADGEGEGGRGRRRRRMEVSRTALEPGANGGNVTLAQLLSLQEQAQNGTEGDEDEEGEAASPPRKSGLSLFGNIR